MCIHTGSRVGSVPSVSRTTGGQGRGFSAQRSNTRRWTKHETARHSALSESVNGSELLPPMLSADQLSEHPDAGHLSCLRHRRQERCASQLRHPSRGSGQRPRRLPLEIFLKPRYIAVGACRRLALGNAGDILVIERVTADGGPGIAIGLSVVEGPTSVRGRPACHRGRAAVGRPSEPLEGLRARRCPDSGHGA